MRDYIEREEAIRQIRVESNTYFQNFGHERSIEVIKSIPAANVIPINVLCEWLSENASLPADHLMISANAWKRKLLKIQEGLNAID